MSAVPMAKLEKLTRELPPLPFQAQPPCEAGFLEGQVDGVAHAFELLVIPGAISAVRLFLSAGTQFPQHTHAAEREWCIIFEGQMRMVCDGVEEVLSAGDYSVCDKGLAHAGEALSDVWALFVAVPDSEDFPHGGT